MTDQPPAPSGDVSRPDSRRLGTTAVVVGLALFAAYIYFDGKKSRDAAEARLAEQVSQNAELQKSMANLQEVVSDLKTSKLYQQQEQAIARDASLTAVQVAKTAEDRIAQLRSALKVWQAKRSEILDGEAGRKIASDWKLVERADRLLSPYLPTAETADQLAQRLDSLMQPVKRAAEQDTAFTPSKDLQSRIADIESNVNEQLDEIQRATRDLAALAKEASALTAHETMTLQAALETVQEHRDQERRETEDSALGEARREGAVLIAKEKAEAQRKIDIAQAEATKLAGERAAAKIVQEAQAEQRRQQEAMAAKKLAEEKAARDADFEKALPDIKHYLSALVENGTTYTKNAAKPGPVSYAKLVEWHAMKEGRTGMEGLMYVASIQNDRNQGPIPKFIGSASGFERTNTPELRKAHALLLKYAKQMVEKGLLAP